MNLSTRGRYAMRAMLQLAQHYGQSPVSSAEISRSQEISMRYLQQLLGLLKRAGLVRVSMGPGGGFVLGAHPSQIQLSQILDAVEGPIVLVDCVADPRVCHRAPDCPTRDLWCDATERLHNYFESLTLADVLRGNHRTQTSRARAPAGPLKKNAKSFPARRRQRR